MIKTDFLRQRYDGVNLYKTYSTEGFYILQNETGFEYVEAIDVEGAPYTYSETDKLTPEKIKELEEEKKKEEEANVLPK